MDGSQTISHVAQLDREDDRPVALAKEAIKLLEAQIAEQYRLTPIIGTELEHSIMLGGSRSHAVRNLSKLRFSTSDREAAFKGVPFVARERIPGPLSGDSRFGFWPDSRRMLDTYREDNRQDYVWDKLENVLTHQPRDEEGNPIPRDMLTVAREIEALRYQLFDPATGYKPRGIFEGRDADGKLIISHKRDVVPESVRKIQKFIRDEVKAISIEASIGGRSDITHGVHLNLSLARNGQNRFSQTYGDLDLHRCVDGLQRVFEENLYLLGIDDATMRRWKLRQKEYGEHCDPDGTIQDYTFGRAIMQKYDRELRVELPYIENKLPPMSANPYYAVMMELAGIYDGLSTEKSQPRQIAHKIVALAGEETPDVMKARFENSPILKPMLNRLRPGLGDEFFDAIAQTPPGTEKTKMDKNHAAKEAKAR